MRDMTVAMGVLVVVVLAFVWLYGGFTVSPGKADTSQGVAPSADVEGGFSRTDRMLEFTAVVPTGVPADWHPNSWSVVQPGDPDGRPVTARGGWLTPEGRFISLVQSTGDVAAVLTSEFGRS